MSEAFAKLDIRFTKRVTIKQGTLTDLKNRFALNNDSIQFGTNIDGFGGTSNPEPITINSVTIEADGAVVRLSIPSNEVPQPGYVIKVSYTSGAIVGPPAVGFEDGALVDSSTGYAISDLVAVKTQDISGTVNPPRPTIINAVVEHEAPKVVKLSFTNGRNIQSNSTESTNEANDDGNDG